MPNIPDVPHGRAKIRSCLSAVATALLVLPFSANALQAPQTISLQQALKHTLNQNPSLKVFEFRKHALNGKRSTAALAPAYELSLSANNVAGSGDYTGTDQAEWTVSLSSSFELEEHRQARTALANTGLGRLEAQYQVEALAALGDVTRAYIQVLAAQERVALAQSAHKLAQKTLAQVKARAKAGAAPQADVLRAQAAVSGTQLNVSSMLQTLDYCKVALVALWGETQPDFKQVSGNLYQFGEDKSFDALYERLLQNPAIEVFAAQERVQAANLRFSQTQSSSDISWSLGIKQFQQSNSSALMVGLSKPLFTGSRNKGALRTANARLHEATAEKDAALLRLRTQLYLAYNNRQQAMQSVKTLTHEIVPALTQALNDTRKAYQGGRYRYVDYLSARQDLIAARASLINAGASALSYGAEIEQLSAQPLSIAIKAAQPHKFAGQEL